MRPTVERCPGFEQVNFVLDSFTVHHDILGYPGMSELMLFQAWMKKKRCTVPGHLVLSLSADLYMDFLCAFAAFVEFNRSSVVAMPTCVLWHAFRGLIFGWKFVLLASA